METKHFTKYQIYKAKKEHRKKYPACALTGYRPKWYQSKNDVHHIKPVHAFPGLACDPSNLITLATKVNVHFIVGHYCDWQKWNGNVWATLSELHLAFKQTAIKRERFNNAKIDE